MKELAAERVVRFDVSAQRLSLSASVSGLVLGAGVGGGVEGLASPGGERGRAIIHGYDAVYLARWLSRDPRLPLTFHAVSKEDCEEVLSMMRATASPDEVAIMLERGELVRDPDTGLVSPNSSQGATSRLVDDDEGEYECLDWEYFLMELDRLAAQIVAARHQLMLDRGYGKKQEAMARMQALSELDCRVEARRSQLRHITANFDASEVLADLYHMADIVKSVRRGEPMCFRDPHSPLAGRYAVPKRLSALDAEDWEQQDSEEEYEYEQCDVAYGGKVRQRGLGGQYKVSSSKAGARARW